MMSTLPFKTARIRTDESDKETNEKESRSRGMESSGEIIRRK